LSTPPDLDQANQGSAPAVAAGPHQPRPAPEARPAPARPVGHHPLLGFLVWAATVLALVNLLLGAIVFGRYPALGALLRTPAAWDAAAIALADRVVGGLVEEPHFAQVRGASAMPICRDVAEEHQRPLINAFNLMRRTDEGQRLFRQLLDEGICVRTGEIPYNSGFAYVVQSITGSWARSYIMVAVRHVEADEPDVLAAIVVHEATHVDRYLQGTACSYAGTCTLLPNGVELEEEIAAHAAEAEWWIAAYGTDGKRFAFGYDYGMNELVEAYLAGPEAFAAYVREIRSDDREGGGV
jgi:hypothetical protein